VRLRVASQEQKNREEMIKVVMLMGRMRFAKLLLCIQQSLGYTRKILAGLNQIRSI
jgi:hypothetical protein